MTSHVPPTYDTLKTVQHIDVAQNTVKAYIDHLIDSFLFAESKRYDVKGCAYFNYPNKYYCEDVGLCNARIGFRQPEMTYIMENIIYNELVLRGYSVDVGVITTRERNKEGKHFYDDNGILNIEVIDFLLDDSIM